MSEVQDESTTVMSGRCGPRTSGRRGLAVLASSASIAFVVLLSGCTFGEHYAIFDRKAEPADAPPSELADQELPGVDVDRLRFATEYEGDRLYLAKGVDGMGICLLIDGPGDGGVSSYCGGGSWVGAQGPSRHEYHVHPDGTPLPDDVYMDLTENISVKRG